MRQVTSDFKNEIKKYSRQIKGVLEINGEAVNDENVNSVSLVTLGNLLKSCMREMDVVTSEEVHKDDILHFEFGVKVRDNGENDYDFIDYGNFIVAKEPEIQEDKETYRIVCYDKMINTMKDYESLQHGTFPMTIRDYINNLCLDCNLVFKNVNDTFVNYNRILQNDPYEGLNYTYRDIFDELAQVTASTICIDMETDKLEVRYVTDSGVELDEESFRDINVNFDDSMKPINTIVLSRSAGADKIAQSIPANLPDEQKNAIEISDNQIMNFDDRGDYIPEILNKLYGLSYALNDFESTGICYLDLCDKYSVSIRDNSYDCVLLNDDIRITTGINEKIYTENIEGTDTDYSKTDKIDQKINKVSLIVDKQQGIIEGLVSKIVDISVEKDTLVARMTFENINESEPFSIKVHPLNKNISYLYPFNGLYPSDDLYMTSRTLRFLNTTTNEAFDLELPDDLLYYDEDNYDEFVLDYPTKQCYVIKRCKYTADGDVELLSEPKTTYYDYPSIHLTSGNYTVMLLAMQTGYIYAKLMLKNDFTSQMVTDINMDSRLTQTAESIESEVSANYATKTELGTTETTLNSRITETASEISSEVSKKVGEDEVISKINQSAEQVAINANKIDLEANDILNLLSGETINMTSKNIAISSTNFSVTKNGKMTCSDAEITGGSIEVVSTEGNPALILKNSNLNSWANTIFGGEGIYMYSPKYNNRDVVRINAYGEIPSGSIQIYSESNILSPSINLDGLTGIVTCVAVEQTSLESKKKNFEKLENGLDIIKKIDIYKYHFKTQDDNEKKHIGFVIGDKYNYAKEVTSNDNDGADIYSFVAVCCKAIQEQQKHIEELEKRIKVLEERID